METPRLDRDLGGRADGAGRVFTRVQLEAELAAVEHHERRLDTHIRVSESYARCPLPGTSAFAPSPASEEQELSPRFQAELDRLHRDAQVDAEQARRLGNE